MASFSTPSYPNDINEACGYINEKLQRGKQLLKEKDALEAELKAERMELHRVKNHEVALVKYIKDLKDSVTASETDDDSLQKTKRNLIQGIEALIDAMSQIQKNREETEARNQSLKQEKEPLNEALSQCQQDRKEIEARNKRLAQIIDELQQSHKDKKAYKKAEILIQAVREVILK